MNLNEKSFVEGLQKIGLDLDNNKLSSFHLYYKNLTKWNEVMNLTAIREEKDVYEKHFLDSLTIVKTISVEQIRKGVSFIDVGTGAGFPGLPIAIAFPNTRVVLMDSLQKRIRFLEDTIEKLGLINVKAVHARAEDLARHKEYREQFDLCCSRAVANLSTLSEYCLPFVKVGGYFLSYKSESVSEELKNSGRAIQILGGGNETIEKFTLPGTDYQRVLVKVEKVRSTPKKYPRKAGTPSKEPLL